MLKSMNVNKVDWLKFSHVIFIASIDGLINIWIRVFLKNVKLK